MKVLLTGANGYVGTRLLHRLLEKGHTVVALVRNSKRLQIPDEFREKVVVLQADLLNAKTLQNLPEDLDACYYLVHTMSDNPKLFSERDRTSALNFHTAIQRTRCKQIIYLSGLTNDAELSEHLSSRLEVEKILKYRGIPLTVLRSSIIIGSGSASFEIIRDLVEKLPIMIAPKWVRKKCQPIAIANVLDYLIGVLGNEQCLGKTFQIGGPESIPYQDMLKRYAKKRNLKRIIIPVPLFTPSLSSYWLIFITNTNFYLARSLVESLKNDSVQTDFSIHEILPNKLLTYEEAIDRALQKIQQNAVVSSWRDAFVSSGLEKNLEKYIEAPHFGCLTQTTVFAFSGDPDQVMEAVYMLGGKKGYYMNWAWKLRGAIDRASGGVGVRRGKTERKKPRIGDALDFWRVLMMEERRFLLYAEMNVPGEAWLEFRIASKNNHFELIQVATFRPRGILGRLYWYLLYPAHVLIFQGIGKRLIREGKGKILSV